MAVTDEKRDNRKAVEAAAAWHARLGNKSVSAQTLREFRNWRADPANAAAYARVDTAWRRSGGLSLDREIRAATAEALDRGRGLARWPGASTLFPIAGALAIVLAALAFVALWTDRPRTYATQVGEQRMIVLADGSRVWLDTNSQIEVRLHRAKREVDLAQGQALFQVAHDAAHPFTVRAGNAEVRAIGTRFDVRREGSAVQVLLIEGVVAVRRTADGSTWRLGANQKLLLPPHGAAAAVTADTARAASWTTGRLTFEDTPLGDALAEVNRYSPHKLVLSDPILAQERVSGVFEAGDTRAFAAAMSELYSLRQESGANGEIVLRARTAPAPA